MSTIIFSCGTISDICSFTDNGNTTLYASSLEGKVAMWDVKSGQMIAHFNAHEDLINSVKVFSQDYFYTASYDTSVKLWDCRNLSSPVYTFNGHESMIFGLEVSPYDRLVLSHSADGKVILWNGEDCKIIGEIKVDYIINRILRTNSTIGIQENHFVELYNYGGNRIESFNGHEGNLITSFHTYNNTFFTGSIDRTVKMFNETGKELSTFVGHKAQINAMHVHNRWLYTGGSDGAIMQYTIPL